MHPAAHIAYEFGDFRFDPEAARLSHGGEVINLEPKAIAVLGQMVAHPGHLCERDELLDAVWGHRHVTPSTLNRIVTLLRNALGDERTQASSRSIARFLPASSRSSCAIRLVLASSQDE